MYLDRKTLYSDNFCRVEIWEAENPKHNIGTYLDQSGVIKFSPAVANYVSQKLKSGDLNVLKYI